MCEKSDRTREQAKKNAQERIRPEDRMACHRAFPRGGMHREEG